MTKALVILSGGQDSTTCLYWAKAQGWDVFAITFDYGQRHDREIRASQRICAYTQTPHKLVHIRDVLVSASPLTDPNVSLEQYAGPQSLPGGLEKTFVPMRNQLFITIAANWAYHLGCRKLVTGVCEEDYGGYPDCRRAFIDQLENACNLGAFTGEDGALNALQILTPLMWRSKAETVKLAMELPGCYAALALTHTSYDGRYPPTGHDHATLLREKGFIEAGVPDPLWLRAFMFLDADQLPNTPNYQGDLSKFYALIDKPT